LPRGLGAATPFPSMRTKKPQLLLRLSLPGLDLNQRPHD
jgi:hypothetical protein